MCSLWKNCICSWKSFSSQSRKLYSYMIYYELKTYLIVLNSIRIGIKAVLNAKHAIHSLHWILIKILIKKFFAKDAMVTSFIHMKEIEKHLKMSIKVVMNNFKETIIKRKQQYQSMYIEKNWNIFYYNIFFIFGFVLNLFKI